MSFSDLPEDVVDGICIALRHDIRDLGRLACVDRATNAAVNKAPRAWAQAAVNALPHLPRGSVPTTRQDLQPLLTTRLRAKHCLREGLRGGERVVARVTLSPRCDLALADCALYRLPAWEAASDAAADGPAAARPLLGAGCFSPDSAYLLLHGPALPARLVCTETLRELQALPSMTGGAWSFDSRHISGWCDGELRLWDFDPAVERFTSGPTWPCPLPLGAAPRTAFSPGADSVALLAEQALWLFTRESEPPHVFTPDVADIGALREAQWLREGRLLSVWGTPRAQRFFLHEANGEDFAATELAKGLAAQVSAIGRDGETLAFGSNETLCLVDLRPGGDQTPRQVEVGGEVTDLAYNDRSAPRMLAACHASPEGPCVRVFRGTKVLASQMFYEEPSVRARWLNRETLAIMHKVPQDIDGEVFCFGTYERGRQGLLRKGNLLGPYPNPGDWTSWAELFEVSGDGAHLMWHRSPRQFFIATFY